nr:hypothetical protein [Polymorphobacter sp.]
MLAVAIALAVAAIVAAAIVATITVEAMVAAMVEVRIARSLLREGGNRRRQQEGGQDQRTHGNPLFMRRHVAIDIWIARGLLNGV